MAAEEIKCARWVDGICDYATRLVLAEARVKELENLLRCAGDRLHHDKPFMNEIRAALQHEKFNIVEAADGEVYALQQKKGKR